MTSGTASADVDSVEGTGYGLSVFAAGAFLIPPTPDPNVNPPRLQANESSVDFGPHASSVATVGGVLGILNNGVAVGPVATQAGNIIGENHGGFIGTTSQVANVAILANAVVIPLIASSCVSNGDGSTGATTVSNATISGQPLLNGPIAPNTTIDVLGLATVVLNEQVITNTPPSGGNPGSTQIRVRGAVVRIPADGSIAEIVLAESFCRAVGPDVLLPSTTTSTTTAATTTTSTTSTTVAGATTTTSTTVPATTTTSTTSTTVPGATTTTTSTTTSTSTTSTTSPPTGTVASTTTTTVAGVVTTVSGGGLVRTGADLQPLAVMSVVSIVLGILLLIGSGRPLTAGAGAVGGVGYAPVVGTGPEKWGPAEILRTIWAGFGALVIGIAGLLIRGNRRRE